MRNGVSFKPAKNRDSDIPQPRKYTILVMEDEPISRQLFFRVLINEGYEVLLAEDGVQGVEIFRSRPDSIDLIILDLLMPNMNGFEALTLIRDTRPGVLAVVSTGCPAADVLEILGNISVSEIFMKPFSIRKLASRVQKILEPE